MNYVYIDTPQSLEEGLSILAHAQVIGVDTEGDSLHSYKEKVSLIQMSGDDRDLIIDPLALKDLTPLADILSRPEVLKVFHGTDYDVVVLKRDFGFQISPIFDTCLAARACAIQKFSLADLLHKFFRLSVDKRYQKADWSARPLSLELLEYAALDTHYLPQLYHLLKVELEARGRLKMVEEECRLLAQREWTGKSFEPNDYLRIKGAAKLPEQTQRVVRALAVARDQIAQRLDRPAFKVLSNQDLLLIATQQPGTEPELANLFPRASHSIRRRASFWLSAVRQSLQDKEPLPSLPKHRSQSFSQAQQVLFQRLREWRDAQAKAEGVEPAMVFSSQDLQQLVKTCSADKRGWPKTAEELARITLLRPWQMKRYGEALIALINHPHHNKTIKN
jgi:ribonuclease D